MFAKRSTHFVVAAVLMVLWSFGVASVVFAGDMVPLKGKFVGEYFDFGGKMTHLGKFEGAFTGPASTVWIAANGDTVDTVTTSFVIDVPSGVVGIAPDGSDLYAYTQTLEINGGTGRFENAMGAATVEGVTTLSFSYYDGAVVGTVTRPNSRK